MSYAITLTTQDGQQLSFHCNPEQTIQEAAEEAGFFLPAYCNAGSCGACLGHCSQGDYRLSSYSPNLLAENHRELGEILLCRTYPNSDLQLSTIYTAAQINNPQQTVRQAEIVSVGLIAERTTRLVLQLLPDAQSGLRFDFEPGQFVELEVPELHLKRAYSIANSPNPNGRLEFLIRLQPQGQFSEYLQYAAKPKQYLQVQGAFGHFGVQTSVNPRCFVAGGAGLAPFLSILLAMAERGEDYPTVLFFGVNTEQEIFYQQELAELQNYLPQLKVYLCVWQPSENWRGFRGTAADALKVYLAKTQSTPDVFLCGPALLVDAATQIAVAAGVKPAQIFAESFT